jgi:hypothetical protein
VDPCLDIIMEKHHDAATAVMDHLAEKNDDQGLVLLDEMIEYQFMFLRVMNDAFRAAAKEKHGTT